MAEKIKDTILPENEAEVRRDKAEEEKPKRSDEEIEAAKKGIKRRLGDWQRNDLYSLREHLRKVLMRGRGRETFNKAYDEMLECCKEGTEEGRVWGNKKGKGRIKIANDPGVAKASLIEKLPWVVGHDNISLGFQAEDVVTVEDLLEVAEGIIK